jgi:hypothetical protein
VSTSDSGLFAGVPGSVNQRARHPEQHIFDVRVEGRVQHPEPRKSPPNQMFGGLSIFRRCLWGGGGQVHDVRGQQLHTKGNTVIHHRRK